jgi:hypothetical protein
VTAGDKRGEWAAEAPLVGLDPADASLVFRWQVLPSGANHLDLDFAVVRPGAPISGKSRVVKFGHVYSINTLPLFLPFLRGLGQPEVR